MMEPDERMDMIHDEGMLASDGQEEAAAKRQKAIYGEGTKLLAAGGQTPAYDKAREAFDAEKEATKTSCCGEGEPKKKEKYCGIHRGFICDARCRCYDEHQEDCGFLVVLNSIAAGLKDIAIIDHSPAAFVNPKA